MGAIAAVGVRSLMTMQFEEAAILLDEMMECVEVLPDARRPDFTRPLDADYTEEVTTRLMLRSEVFELHRSEEHTSELQSLMRKSYAVFCLKKTIRMNNYPQTTTIKCTTCSYHDIYPTDVPVVNSYRLTLDT